MGPEWCQSVMGDFKEESFGDGVYRLDKVFAEEESACAKVQAGAYPFAQIWCEKNFLYTTVNDHEIRVLSYNIFIISTWFQSTGKKQQLELELEGQWLSKLVSHLTCLPHRSQSLRSTLASHRSLSLSRSKYSVTQNLIVDIQGESIIMVLTLMMSLSPGQMDAGQIVMERAWLSLKVKNWKAVCES